MRPSRRHWLSTGAIALAGRPDVAFSSGPQPHWEPVKATTTLRFPDDHGAHPGHRIEWWYVTGWLQRPDAPEIGFQVTFFRSLTAHPQGNPSAFAPRQLILAHAALALPERGRLLHADRASRTAFDMAGAGTGDTRVWVGRGDSAWSLVRDPATDRYRAHIQGDPFELDLELAPNAPPLLQGDSGFSRKGPELSQASHYYSRPQLRVSGRLSLSGKNASVSGTAWFDHEWASELLAPGALGWDWVGINLDDGGALMAFRVRDREGGVVWRTAMLRDGPQGPVRRDLIPQFEPLRTWRSNRTGARWPVEMRLKVGSRTLDLKPLLDDQELNTRGSTGTTYWEGAVTAVENGRQIGRGYLELTGYAGAVRF